MNLLKVLIRLFSRKKALPETNRIMYTDHYGVEAYYDHNRNTYLSASHRQATVDPSGVSVRGSAPRLVSHWERADRE